MEPLTEYNIVGPASNLEKVVKKFDLRITERWGEDDINVLVRERDEDDFSELCTELKIVYEIV